MSSQLWHEDTPKQFDTTDIQNLGWAKRLTYIASGKSIPMVGRLHSELFNQERYMISDAEITVELTLAKDTFYLMSSHTESGKYKTAINDAKLYVPYVQLSEKTMDEIKSQLKTKPMI